MFFRKLRRWLYSQKKFPSNLDYATGEIILVVAGILIALQINNYNQNRLDYLKSINYYERLVEDLEAIQKGPKI